MMMESADKEYKTPIIIILKYLRKLEDILKIIKCNF